MRSDRLPGVPRATHATPFAELLAPEGSYRRRIDSRLHSWQSTLECDSLRRPIRFQLEGGGKHLRPLMTLWFGELMGADPDSTCQAAVAVELLHNFLLAHDDMEDGDEFRRGRPTLWKEFGLATALNASDALLAACYQNLLATTGQPHLQARLLKEFTDVLWVTIEGQALDLAARARSDMRIADYESIIQKKTGRYLALGWVAAALIAEQGAPVIEQLWRIGTALGPAFQIRDDVLDLTPGKGRGGLVGCDIREGKASILYAYALESARLAPGDRQRLIEIHARTRETTTDAEVAWVIELFRGCGAIQFASDEANRRARQAVDWFEQLPDLPANASATFRDIAAYVVNRKV